MSPLSAALAQLVLVEAAQLAQLTETRTAIAALEKISGNAVEVRRASVAFSTPAPVLVKGHRGAAAAAARVDAILRLIAAGPRRARDLRVALPVPDGATERQHRQSIANALTRLKADGFLVNREDGWTLTAKGRKRAAKEEP